MNNKDHVNGKNHLQGSASPYLQQHADNPVDWYPWGEEAIQKSRKENKPILLSIGYFACHWCHVMARESFVDTATAEIMNKHFINIKVDREERPDLDRIYQLAYQILTGKSGGWPLTVFLTPHDLMPFYVGTYFPLEPRYGIPSFKEILLKIIYYFKYRPNEISQQNSYLKNILLKMESYSETDQALDDKPLSNALKELTESFDKVNGGFNGAPKFPQPSILDYLLYIGDKEKIAYFTLLKMAKGGIYDQLGGGFFRYSVDAEWKIPHFEKMLYDNAQLLFCYSQAGLVYNEPHFNRVVTGTIQWLLEEMQAPEGGFYSSLDAESEHLEGKYYYWDPSEIKSLITHEEYQAIASYYGLELPPNFDNHWHFAVCNENISYSVLGSARQKLLKARQQRKKPGRDEKVLTSWNALLIKGLCLSSRYLESDDVNFTAQRIVKFIRDNLWKENKLYACYRNKQTYQVAYLDDYVFLMDALFSLLQEVWDTEYLNFIIDLVKSLIINYYDEKTGGFFFTPHEYESIIYRNKPLIDNVIPSGNGIAAFILTRLGYFLGNTSYLEIAERIIKTAWSSLQSAPSSHSTLLKALAEYIDPPEIVIIRADENNVKFVHKEQTKNYDPRQIIFAIPNSEKNLPSELQSYIGYPGKSVIYKCKRTKCSEKSDPNIPPENPEKKYL